ncbi:MAG: hypothetical protein KKB38_20330, partial [Gammaproteobacteria bacterium]|nr:hypothetical protein [Gammaproteobacteria bacterium]
MTQEIVQIEEKPEIEKPEVSSKEQKYTQKEILQKIEDGVKWVKSGEYIGDEARSNQWKKNKKYKKCIWPDSKKNDIAVNTIWANFHLQLPHLYFRNPRITAISKQPTFKRDDFGYPMKDENGNPVLVNNYLAGKKLSIKINYELKELGFKKIAKRCVADVLCPYGIGIAKVGFSKITQTEGTEKGDKYSYWISRVDPNNFCFDPFANDLEFARWTAERIQISIKDARDSGFNIPKGYVASIPEHEKDKLDKIGSDGLAYIWEFHDLENNVLYWVLDGQKDSQTLDEEWIKEPEINPYPFEGTSYADLVFDIDNDDVI